MAKEEVFYICPVCFQTCDTEMECHEHRALECFAGKPGAPCRRPLQDRFGQFVSRAPRWYLEAQNRIPAYTPFRSQKD